jgi:hypothetical protein
MSISIEAAGRDLVTVATQQDRDRSADTGREVNSGVTNPDVAGQK